MRKTAFPLTLVLALAGTAAPGQQDQITATIDAQLDAFTRRDAVTAFSYASPTIQNLFGTAETFAAMVQNGYPMVWTPQSTRMLGLRNIGGSLWQQVHVTDAQGRGWMLDYQMIETPDGWRINGVQILPDLGLGA